MEAGVGMAGGVGAVDAHPETGVDFVVELQIDLGERVARRVVARREGHAGSPSVGASDEKAAACLGLPGVAHQRDGALRLRRSGGGQQKQRRGETTEGGNQAQKQRSRAPALPRSRAPALPRSRAPALPRSRAPALPRSRAPALPRSRAPAHYASQRGTVSESSSRFPVPRRTPSPHSAARRAARAPGSDASCRIEHDENVLYHIRYRKRRRLLRSAREAVRPPSRFPPPSCPDSFHYRPVWISGRAPRRFSPTRCHPGPVPGSREAGRGRCLWPPDRCPGQACPGSQSGAWTPDSIP